MTHPDLTALLQQLARLDEPTLHQLRAAQRLLAAVRLRGGRMPLRELQHNLRVRGRRLAPALQPLLDAGLIRLLKEPAQGRGGRDRRVVEIIAPGAEPIVAAGGSDLRELRRLLALGADDARYLLDLLRRLLPPGDVDPAPLVQRQVAAMFSQHGQLAL